MSKRGAFSDFDRVPAEFMARLADLITHADDVKVVQTLREALDAEISVRSPLMNVGGQSGTRYESIPDWRVRVSAAKIMAEIKHGRPRQQIEMNVGFTLNAPMSKAEATRELIADWDSIRRIGDETVRFLQQALPAPADGEIAESADAQLVDVELGDV